jgi:long-chain acyl-CoA synthetase
MISFLPSAHIADRWAGLYAQMFYGNCVFCCPDPRQMVAYSIEVKPTVWGGVPRIWEKLKAAIEIGIAAEADEAKREATVAAIELGRRRARAHVDGGAPAELETEWKRADEQVLSRIRAMLGLDQVESFVVGAAPTPPEVLEFFLALGIEIRETWGMSETTAITTLNPPGKARVGTVGPPIPNTEVKLAEDGEVMVRGPQVMVGYRNLPEKTAEALTDDGWLLTGDIGEFDEQGYLRIVDRKKELIINAAGKNMSPANIEAKLKAASTLIAQAVAIGDNRPYNVALIALDPESLAARGAAADDPAVAKEIAEAVEAANARLSRVEQIKRYKLLSGEWQPGGEELTPTMKLKRRPIERKYENEIEALYAA